VTQAKHASLDLTPLPSNKTQTKKKKRTSSRPSAKRPTRRDSDESDPEDELIAFEDEDGDDKRQSDSRQVQGLSSRSNPVGTEQKQRQKGYGRQQTPHPDEIATATERPSSKMREKSKDLTHSLTEEDEDENDDGRGGRSDKSKDAEFKKKGYSTRKHTPFPSEIERESSRNSARSPVDAIPDDDLEDSRGKVHFSQSNQYEVEGEDRAARRRESYKTRKQTPYPDEIESNLPPDEDESQTGTARERQRKENFKSRKHTPYPNEIEKALGRGGSDDRQQSIAEDDAVVDADLDRYFGLDTDDDPFSNNSGQRQPPHNRNVPQAKSAPSHSESFQLSRSGSREGPNDGQRNVRLRPITPEGHFRREHSQDHPLNGGSGKYAREQAKGRQIMGPVGYGKKHKRIAEVVSKQEQKKLDLQRQLEALRKHQNDTLLEVLEEERKAEEERTKLGRAVSDPGERSRCCLHILYHFIYMIYKLSIRCITNYHILIY
jgi:hypothetical protein